MSISVDFTSITVFLIVQPISLESGPINMNTFALTMTLVSLRVHLAFVKLLGFSIYALTIVS